MADPADHIYEVLKPVLSADRFKRGPGGELYASVTEEEFTRAVNLLSTRKFVLIALFGVEEFGNNTGASLLYTFEKRGGIVIIVRNADRPVSSIAVQVPAATWPERECRDAFGIEFTGAFDTRKLFLHEVYPEGFHPLKKSFKNEPINTKAAVDPTDEYAFKKVIGEGIYQVPVGPVHAGIIEPGHFRFSVIGETIFNLEIRMFYKHRGIEKLAEGKTPEECIPITEAVSGDESVANATGFCIAAEKISGITIPDRAWYLRTILLEMERITSHLGDQAGMLIDVAFPLGASQFAVLREEFFRKNESLTGSRFLRGMLAIGGLRNDIRKEHLYELDRFLEQFRKRYRIGLKIVLSTSSVLDRFATTGVIRPALLRPLNITGPAARASGGKVDTRINCPYGIYNRYSPTPKILKDGDVLSRFTVKAAEIMDSVDIIRKLIQDMPEGNVCADGQIRDGFTHALVESARGENFCWVWIKEGKIERYKVRTASFCNWLAIEHAVQGNIIPDFPVINKSLNLSYAGTDL